MKGKRKLIDGSGRKSEEHNRNGRQAGERTATTPSLPPHLDKFAQAVADGHSHVQAAIMCGRAAGSASFFYRQPGVMERIAELRTIRKKAADKIIAKKAAQARGKGDIDEVEIVGHLTGILRSETEPSPVRIRASTALSHILKEKGLRDLKAHGWSSQEISELFATGRVPTRFQGAGNAEAQWVIDATRDAFTWMTQHTKTKNEHWKEEGRPGPYEPLPPHEYLRDLFEAIELEGITWIEKSRDLMISWAAVGYFTLNAMIVPARGVIFQTQKDDKVIQLVEYAKCLYSNQDPRLQKAFPLSKPIEQQPANRLDFANGSFILGIPGGANQIRSYHPWGYLNDESSFQADAGECYNEALSAVKGKIVFNSSAGVGWYADARRDIATN